MLERFFIAKSFRLHISKPKKIPGNIFRDVSKVRKSSRRGLLGKIFDELRIRGRMQFFEFVGPCGHIKGTLLQNSQNSRRVGRVVSRCVASYQKMGLPVPISALIYAIRSFSLSKIVLA